MDDRKGPSSNHDQVLAGIGVPKARPHSFLIGGRILGPDWREKLSGYSKTETAISPHRG